MVTNKAYKRSSIKSVNVARIRDLACSHGGALSKAPITENRNRAHAAIRQSTSD